MDSQARPPQDSGTSAAPGAPGRVSAVTAETVAPSPFASNGSANGSSNGSGTGHRASGEHVASEPRPRVRLLLQYPLVPASSKLPGIARPPIRQLVGPAETSAPVATPATAPSPTTATAPATATAGAAPAAVDDATTVIDLRDLPSTPPAEEIDPEPSGSIGGPDGVAVDGSLVAPKIVPLDVLEGRTPAAPDRSAAGPAAQPSIDGRSIDRERPSSVTRTGLEWLAIVAAALLAALVIKLLLFQVFVIPSLSMEPTLGVRDRVLVNKLSYRLHDIERGDVVVFERPPAAIRPDDDSDLIKRVIGLPGETVEARGGRVLIDGEPLAEPWLGAEVRTADFGPVSVPPGQLFVLGDNRSNSADSRFIGTFDEDLVIGKAFVRWWPPGRAGGL